VTVHPITLLDASGTVLSVPSTPTQAELQTYLSKVYGDQANIFCNVTVTTGAKLNWDVGVGPGQQNGAGNGYFDIIPNANAPKSTQSQEEDAIIQAAHDPDADVNVYFTATAGQGREIFGMNPLLNPTNSNDWKWFDLMDGYAGKAKRENNGVVYVRSYSKPSAVAVFSRITSFHCSYVQAIAHEIGHYVGKLAHSADALTSGRPNPNHLDGTDNEMRLMSGKDGPARFKNP